MLEKLKSFFRRKPKRPNKVFYGKKFPLTNDLQTGDLFFKEDSWRHVIAQYVYVKGKWKEITLDSKPKQ